MLDSHDTLHLRNGVPSVFYGKTSLVLLLGARRSEFLANQSYLSTTGNPSTLFVLLPFWLKFHFLHLPESQVAPTRQNTVVRAFTLRSVHAQWLQPPRDSSLVSTSLLLPVLIPILQLVHSFG